MEKYLPGPALNAVTPGKLQSSLRESVDNGRLTTAPGKEINPGKLDLLPTRLTLVLPGMEGI